ncbi:MAG: barstar family protein [Burkholderiales bacterium]
MGKLIARLTDPARSGVYRASRADDILEVAQGSGLRVARVVLEGATDKSALLERVARALEFPQWFGGNWDALEDCVTDLSWVKADGHVLLVEGAGGVPEDDLGVFADVLASAAAYWAERGRPFFAVFVGGARSLPELFRETR